MRTAFAVLIGFAMSGSAFGCAQLEDLDELQEVACTGSCNGDASATQPDGVVDATADGPVDAASDGSVETTTDGAAPDALADGPRESADAPAPPTVTLVQVAGTGNSLGASQSTAAVIGPGGLLVVAAYWDPSGLATVQVTDTLGNSWVALPEQHNLGAQGLTPPEYPPAVQLWYAENATGGNDTITATLSSGTCYMGFFFIEYAGIATTGALDSNAGQIASATVGSNTMQAGLLTTSSPVDLIVAVFLDSNAVGLMGAGPGFTAESTDTNAYALVEDNVPAGAAPGAHTPTATLPAGVVDNDWAAASAAFKVQ